MTTLDRMYAIDTNRRRGRIICFDCNQPTGSYQSVRRYPYPDRELSTVTLVHRTGTGCHKNDSAYDDPTITETELRALWGDR